MLFFFSMCKNNCFKNWNYPWFKFLINIQYNGVVWTVVYSIYHSKISEWYWRINTIVMDSLMYLLHSQVHKIHKTTFFNEKNIKKSIFSVWNTIFIHTRYNKKFNNIFNGHRFKVHTRIISFIPNKFWMFSNRTSEKIQFTQHRLICLSKIYIHSIKISSSEILWTECKLSVAKKFKKWRLLFIVLKNWMNSYSWITDQIRKSQTCCGYATYSFCKYNTSVLSMSFCFSQYESI